MRFLLFVCFLLLQFSAFAQFISEEKTLTTSTGNLEGTLILPTSSKAVSVVVIQPGSGPTDRNGNNPMGLKANSYRLLAEALAAKNIATLLIDKRGIAKSINAAKSESDLKFGDYADDLAAWITFIKKDKRIKKVFIIGHSEGSLVGMIAAQKVKINGYVSLAGAGEEINKIIVWQVSKQSVELSKKLDSLLLRLSNSQKIDTVPPFLLSVLRPSVQPYMKSWMMYNPCTEIKKLKCPVLILQGSEDIQVEIKQAELLKSCSPKSTLRIIQGMNHVLKLSSSDRTENMKTYADPTLPIVQPLIDELVMFINKK